jgi:hypothetical protein
MTGPRSASASRTRKRTEARGPGSGQRGSASQPRGSASQPRRRAADKESAVTVLYFYKTRWGHHDEFVELFERNHWPLLREGLATGHFLDVKRYVPQFHGDGRADWDVLVSITYRNWAALAEQGPSDLMERLFPDQKRYKEEERHRFAILEAHWDVPLEERPLE